MPKRQPFTALCRAARRTIAVCADLHIHTTHSDGQYTPRQVVDLARRSHLTTVAITDHDTTSGVGEARTAAGPDVNVVAGVEITAEFHDRELHLLGLFVDLDNSALGAALADLRRHRAERFRLMVERLIDHGIVVSAPDINESQLALGRRHLAQMIVKARRASTVPEAFARYLSDGGPISVPKKRLPVAAAIALVRGAGGVAAWAHPSYDGTRDRLRELADLGLQAVEVEYPGHPAGLRQQLREEAASLGLAISGGSDCHGPGTVRREVGACGLDAEGWQALHQLASRQG
jgi:predicted metal-dependent phosphoesterase TrpH